MASWKNTHYILFTLLLVRDALIMDNNMHSQTSTSGGSMAFPVKLRHSLSFSLDQQDTIVSGRHVRGGYRGEVVKITDE